MHEMTEMDSAKREFDKQFESDGTLPTASPRREVSDDSAESSKGKGEAESYQNKKPPAQNNMKEVPKPVFQRDEALTQNDNNNNNEKDPDAEVAIELFVRTLRIDLDLFAGKNKDNSYLLFLKLLISTDDKKIDGYIEIFEGGGLFLLFRRLCLNFSYMSMFMMLQLSI